MSARAALRRLTGRLSAAALGLLGMLAPAAPALAQADPSPYTYGTRYDAARRVVGTIAPDPDGSGPLRFAAARNTYDGAGRLWRVEKGQLQDWQSENVAPAAWPDFTVFQKVETDYDALDRKVAERVIAGGTIYTLTQYSYDAVGRARCTVVRMNPASFAAPPADACSPVVTAGAYGADRVTRNTYDVGDQLLKVERAVGTALKQDYVAYTYTANGLQETVTDANGNKARYHYDGFDRRIAWAFPSTADGTVTASCTVSPVVDTGGALGIAGPPESRGSTDDCEKYAYDRNGNRAKLMKRDGRVLGYAYDLLDRVTAKVVPDACVIAAPGCVNAPAAATRDVYYAYDLRGLQLSARFDSASGTDRVETVYDGFGQVASSVTAMGAASRTLSYLYDLNGNRTQVTHPDGTAFAYGYDGLDRPVAIAQGSTTLVSMAYTARGELASQARGGVASAYGYDAISRLGSIADDLAGAAADVTTGFPQYNPASQVVKRTRSNDAYASRAYRNLTDAYVANGLNQYASVGGTAFVHDANGNLTSTGADGYSYDAENRLIAATGTHSATLTYDPLGRLWSEAGAATTTFAYDGDALALEYDAGGTVLRRYVHGTGEDDPLIWYEGAGLTDRRSLQADHQGSIVSVADAGGTAIRINSYDEYGNRAATNLGRFQYTGQAWLPEAGVYHYKARIYLPAIGRFAQTDPVGYDDQVNLYAYVANDPVNRVDPTGTMQDGFEIRTRRRDEALLRGDMSEDEYRDAQIAEGLGGAAGGAVVATVITSGQILSLASAIYRAVRFERRLSRVRQNLSGWVEKANKKGVGSRFQHPTDKGRRVRVDRGNPKHKLPSQRPDHVVEQSGGKTVDANGKPIVGDKPASTPEAHIPLTEWLKRLGLK